MLPEFTYGKLMLPARPFFASIIFSLQAKSGKLMLPSVAILWVKLRIGKFIFSNCSTDPLALILPRGHLFYAKFLQLDKRDCVTSP